MADDLNMFAVFAKVVEAGGFTAAARALGLSKSVVSRQVTQLEDELGVRLLYRTTRRISLTEAGTAVYERAARMVQEAEEARLVAHAFESAVRGRLKINAPMSFGALKLAPCLPELLARYPDLDLDLTLTDRFVDLMEEGYDLSLRISSLEDSSYIARRIAKVRSRIVGAPALFRARGLPSHPNELSAYPALLYANRRTPTQFRLKHPEGEVSDVTLTPRLVASSSEAMLPVAVAGLGILMAPDFIVDAPIARGELVPVLTEWQLPEAELHALFPHNRHLSAKVRAFVDFAVEKFGQN